jgi:5'-3' exonuclease
MRSERVLYLDGWNIIIAMNAVMHIEDHNTIPIGMYLGTCNQIRTLVDRFKPTKVVFVLDGPEAGARRRTLYPEYKGGRRMKSRESRVQIMEGEDNMVFGVEGAFQNQIIKIYEFLKLLPVSVVMIPYCEADDAITYLALKNKDKMDCIIVSNDRDYLQLVQEGIYVYRWKTKKLYDQNEIEKEFGIKTENFIFRKIILGDISDRVEGVNGIGDGTFTKLQKPLFETICNNVDDFIHLIETMDYSECNTRQRNAIQKSLEQKDKMILAYNLMKLDENCIIEEQRELIKMQLDEQVNKPLSRLSAKLKMQKNFFNKLYKGFDDDKWLQPFVFVKTGIEINC